MTAGRDTADESRWPALFRRSRDPIFILNRQRRIIFVNSAFEAIAQATMTEVRGLVCSMRSSQHALANLGQTLAPPAEVLEGRGQQVRRAIPNTDRGPPWWDIEFLPLLGDDKVLGIVGRIRVVAARNIVERRSMPETWSQLRTRAQLRYSVSLWDGPNTTLHRVVQQTRLAASSGCPTAIIGEAGVGKQTLARTIHALGSRRELPFVGLDCQRLPADAIRKVIVGPLGLSKPDAAGVIFLHDPASLPRDLQLEVAKLVGDHPQVIAGFPVDPSTELQSNRLMGTLHTALVVLSISLPPLREHVPDIPNYFHLFLQRAGDTLAGRTLAPDVIDHLQRHAWPGNFDELAQLARDLIAKCGDQPITATDLPFAIRSQPNLTEDNKSLALDQLLERVELRLIQRALEKAKGNKSRAAELLGIWRPRLLRRMEALGLGTAGDE